MKAWSVYILECADGTLYTGISTDLCQRVQKHNEGKGAKYTRGRTPVTLIYAETCPQYLFASYTDYSHNN